MNEKNNKQTFKREPVKSIDQLTQEQIKNMTTEQVEQCTPHSDDIVLKTRIYGIEIPFEIIQTIYINMKFYEKASKPTQERALNSMIDSSAYFNWFFLRTKKRNQDTIEEIKKELKKEISKYIKKTKHKPFLDNYY